MAQLYEVTLTGSVVNQQVINRWNYVESGVPAAVSRSFGLAFAFGAVQVAGDYPAGTILDKIALLCNADFHFEQLTVLAVYDVEDFYQTPFVPAYGGAADNGDAESPVLAFGFRTNQVRRDVRRATKRFPGVGENDVHSGGVIEDATQTLMDNLALAMTETLTYDDEGNTLTYINAVCSKQRYNPITGLASPTGSAYRYYPEDDGGETEQLAHTAQGVTWEKYTQVRTQVSRQYGRGR